MGALRKREVRTLTGKAYQEAMKRWRAKRKALSGASRPKAKGSLVTKHIEVVATTPEEVQSGFFQPVGDVFVFKPTSEKAMQTLWDRIRNMDIPEYREVFYNRLLGIRPFIRRFLKMGFPKRLPQELRPFPAGLLDFEIYETAPAILDPITKRIVREPSTSARRPYFEIIRDKWLGTKDRPGFLFNRSRIQTEGLFPNTRVAQAVAAVYGIEVDPYATSAKWVRSSTPDMVSEAERNIQFDESAYQHWKQHLVSTMEQLAAAGKSFEPDWGQLTTIFREQAGVRTPEIIERLRRELTPVIEELNLGKHYFEENRTRGYRTRLRSMPTRSRF